MHFNYKARNKDGKLISGEIEANDEQGAILALREQGLYVSNINSSSQSRALPQIFNKVTIKDKIIFTQQLGVMIKSGLSIVEAMEALKEETSDKNFAKVISQVISDVKGGQPLSAAMQKHPTVFDPVYVNTIGSGEKSGKLDDVLQSLTVQLEKDYAITSKLRGAMIYPIFVLTALIAVMILILVVIIPQLKTIFDDSGVPLPPLTKAVIALSQFMIDYLVYIAIAAIILFVLIRMYGKTNSGRHLFDSMKLKIPVFGGLFKKTYMARFARTFSGLTKSGLPLLEIFRTSKQVINNVIYQDEIDKMIKKVEVGEQVSKALKDCKLFPKMVGNLVSVGEKSGSLDQVFDTIANFFDKEVDAVTNNLSTLLEPVLMVIMGLGIGLIIVSVLQPIYGLVNAI
ncbi:MAG: putative type II secretion system protein F [bacterium ADurb.Bin212]|nr:MAG: putative type II secretion system protein F [bacterium ADurb.Bin212]